MHSNTLPESRQRGRRRQPGGPTMADVARRAGVSPMTVSRVINRDGNVQAETRARVDAAISALGYVPNPAARHLAGGRQCRIVLLHGNPSAAYLSAFLVGSLEAASAASAQLVVERWEEGEGAELLVRRLRASRTDAVLLPPPLCDDAALLGALVDAGLPFAQVATGASVAGGSAVTIDDVAAAQAMTARLIAAGHRRIGFVTGAANQSASALRREGYARALAEAGLTFDPSLVVAGDFSYRSGLSAAEALLAREARPTAIFASNDDMAAAAVAVAHRRGLDVPRDLSVCGFDDSAIATTIWPELTTIRQPIAEMAKAATRLLVEAVRDPATARAGEGHERLAFDLVARASDDAPPARA